MSVFCALHLLLGLCSGHNLYRLVQFCYNSSELHILDEAPYMKFLFVVLKVHLCNNFVPLSPQMSYKEDDKMNLLKWHFEVVQRIHVTQILIIKTLKWGFFILSKLVTYWQNLILTVMFSTLITVNQDMFACMESFVIFLR